MEDESARARRKRAHENAAVTHELNAAELTIFAMDLERRGESDLAEAAFGIIRYCRAQSIKFTALAEVLD